MRITKKYLAQFINDWLNDRELEYVVIPEEIENTRYSRADYEAGATKLYIIANHKTSSTLPHIQFYSSYTLSELSKITTEQNCGLIIENHDRRYSLGDLCIWPGN